jgi:toxin ParE1/3/4
MARASVEFHAEARAEYLAAVSWYGERSPRAANSFEAEFSQAIEQIRRSPGSGSVYMKGCRRLLLHQFPFHIVYQSSTDAIFVLAVAHTHRRPGYWRQRL